MIPVPLRPLSLALIVSLMSTLITACTPRGIPGLPGSKAASVPSTMVRKIVVLKSDVPNAAAVCADAEVTYGGERQFVYNRVFKGFTMALPEAGARDLAQDPRVSYMVDDREFKATAIEDFTPVILPQAETLPPGIARVGANLTRSYRLSGSPDGGSVNATIAVLDTGIDLTHPDLNVVESVSLVGDSSRGNDVYGHGTHVAGIIAARRNDQGVVGVAPGARLWSVKVLKDDGTGFLSQIIAGIEYVTENAGRIDVVNMSLGGVGSPEGTCSQSTTNDPYRDAICASIKAGVVYVAAAGNNANDGSSFVPAAYDGVIGVSAIVDTDGTAGGKGETTTRGNDDSFANFSNFGPKIAMAAPGVNVLSTYTQGRYAKLSGTSMASPHVAGAVALYIARRQAPRPTTPEGLSAYVNDIKTGLLGAGIKADNAAYFTGDPDRYPEPLLDARALDPDVIDSIALTQTTDKSSYLIGTDTAVTVTIQIKTDLGSPVTGLTASAFGVKLSGTDVPISSLSIAESTTAPGTYTARLPLTNLTAKSYTLATTVTDNRGVIGSASSTFALEAPVPVGPTMRVSAIRYSSSVDRFGRRTIRIAVEVRDGSNTVVSGVSTTVDVSVDRTVLGSATNTTDSLGLARFAVSRAPLGCYTTTIKQLTKTGYRWDQASDTTLRTACTSRTSTVAGAITDVGAGGNTPVQNSPSQSPLFTAE